MAHFIPHPWAISGKAHDRQDFVLFQEKQMLYMQVMHTPGLIFKASEVIIPVYTSSANLTFGSSEQFSFICYKRNSNIDKLQKCINDKNNVWSLKKD